MKRYKKALALAATLFCQMAFHGCKKEKIDPLPQATQTGANTLGCKVNGKNWVAQDSNEPFNRTFGVEGGYQYAYIDTIRNNVWIMARRNDQTRLHIYIRKVNKPGIYPLNFDTGISPDVGVPKSYGYYRDKSGRYVSNSRYTGTVTVTRADTLNGIVSGTFEFTAYNIQTKQTITVTDGRFDLNTR